MPFNNKEESQSKEPTLINQMTSFIFPQLSGRDATLKKLYYTFKQSPHKSKITDNKLQIIKDFMENQWFDLFFNLSSEEAQEELQSLGLKSSTKLQILAICSLAYLKHKSSFSRIIFKTFCYIACFPIIGFLLYLKNTNLDQFIDNIFQDKFCLVLFSVFAVIDLLIFIKQSLSIRKSKNQLKVLGATESPLVELSKIIESGDKKSSTDVIIRKLYPHQSYCSILLNSVVFGAVLSALIAAYSISKEVDVFYIIWTFIAWTIIISSLIWSLYSSCNTETKIVKQTINHINELSNALKAHEQKKSEKHSSHSERSHTEASEIDSEEGSAYVEGSKIDAREQQTIVVEHAKIDIPSFSGPSCGIQ